MEATWELHRILGFWLHHAPDWPESHPSRAEKRRRSSRRPSLLSLALVSSYALEDDDLAIAGLRSGRERAVGYSTIVCSTKTVTGGSPGWMTSTAIRQFPPIPMPTPLAW